MFNSIRQRLFLRSFSSKTNQLADIDAVLNIYDTDWIDVNHPYINTYKLIEIIIDSNKENYILEKISVSNFHFYIFEYFQLWYKLFAFLKFFFLNQKNEMVKRNISHKPMTKAEKQDLKI